MKTRISMDLGDSRWIQLLKLEAQQKGTSMKEVLIHALQSYFQHRLETQALAKASEKIFEEWNDPRDAEYDKL